MVKQPFKTFFKKDVIKNSQNSQENTCAGISFLVFSCEFSEVCKNIFLQNSTGRLLLIIAVSIVAKGVLANKTVNYDTQTMYMY